MIRIVESGAQLERGDLILARLTPEYHLLPMEPPMLVVDFDFEMVSMRYAENEVVVARRATIVDNGERMTSFENGHRFVVCRGPQLMHENDIAALRLALAELDGIQDAIVAGDTAVALEGVSLARLYIQGTLHNTKVE